jgi:hypothetical protein
MSVLERVHLRNKYFQKHQISGDSQSLEFSIKLRKSKRNSHISSKRKTQANPYKEFPPDLMSIIPSLFNPDHPLEEKIKDLDNFSTPANKKYFPSIVQALLNIENLNEKGVKIMTFLKNFLDMAFDELLNLDSPMSSHLIKLIGKISYEDDSSKFTEKHLMILTKLLNHRFFLKDFETLVVIIGNLACDIEKRDSIIRLEVWKSILKITSEKKVVLSSLSNIFWLLSTLLKGHPPPPLFYVKSFVEQTFQYLSHSSDEDLAEILWGYSYILEHPKLISLVLDLADFQLFCSLATNKTLEVPAIRCVGLLLSHRPIHAKDFLDSGLAEYFLRNFNDLDTNTKMDVLWVLIILGEQGKDYLLIIISLESFSSITAAVTSIDEILKKRSLDFIESCLKELDYVESVSLFRRMESLFFSVVFNLKTACFSNILVTLRILFKLFEDEEELEMLTGNKREFYLKFGEFGGLDVLEKLQYHESHEVYSSCKRFIQRFWEFE